MRRALAPEWIFAISAILFAASWVLHPPEFAPIDRPTAPPGRRTSPLSSGLGELNPGLDADAQARSRWRLALTFDDGPHPVYTARLLEILARHEVKAAFFINGYWLDQGRARETTRQLVREMHRQGHLIGNHTYGHRLLAGLPKEQQRWEIVANEESIARITGAPPTLFRSPYGKLTTVAAEVLRERGYTLAGWDVTDDGADFLDAAAISARFLRWLERTGGGVLLLHDRLPQSGHAVELLLSAIEAANCRHLALNLPTFQVVSLDSLLTAPSESAAHAREEASERARHHARLSRMCEGGVLVMARGAPPRGAQGQSAAPSDPRQQQRSSDPRAAGPHPSR